MSALFYPLLYQINTRVWLTELSQKLGRSATLDDIPDSELDHLVAMGFDWVWFLSVWQTGLGAQHISRTNAEWRREFQETLPDLREEDIAGSGFAITGYTVQQGLGGDAALARLRERLRMRGLRLMLDFVPNHMGLDHPWVEEHPEHFITGTELDLARAPKNYTWVKRKGGDLLLAYGRDPYFAGWPDTLQLNYANPATQEAMIGELVKIASQCDGVRCDMAMLILPDVFERTWGQRAPLFWPTATQRVRQCNPDFLFMAEVYWDLEWTLQEQGFDYAYDKRLYDRLREHAARPVREHFHAGLDYQNKLARFPGEPRRAARCGDVPSGNPRSGGGDHISVPGAAILPARAVRGAAETDLASSLPRTRRARRSCARSVLRQSLDHLASASRARWSMATARMRPGLGRQLDERLLCSLWLAWSPTRAVACGGELRPEPEPVSPPAAVSGSGRQILATARPNQLRQL